MRHEMDLSRVGRYWCKRQGLVDWGHWMFAMFEAIILGVRIQMRAYLNFNLRLKSLQLSLYLVLQLPTSLAVESDVTCKRNGTYVFLADCAMGIECL